MNHHRFIACGAVAITVFSAPAIGQVTLGPFTRYVEAHASASTGGSGPTERIDGAGYGLFDELVNVYAEDPPIAQGSGLARQQSNIQPVAEELQVSISGRVFGLGHGPMTAGSGSGRSLAVLEFTVIQSIPWRLLTNMTTRADGPSFGFATSKLERLSPAPATLADHSYWFFGPQTASGMLSPGVYRFTTDFNISSPNEGSAEYNYNVLLAIPSAPSVVLAGAGLLASTRRRRPRIERRTP
ncbi:MAG: hypothetical protein JNK58_11590 [Phycisphaerae bacterium]|nr:hypothetical protein [Phycisphaerae bacterium]